MTDAGPHENPRTRARIAGRVLRRLPVVRRLAIGRVGPLEAGLAGARAELARLGAAVADVRSAVEQVAADLGHLRADVAAVSHNHELLKGELWDTRVELSAGRVGEVREQVTALDRRLRRAERSARAVPAGPAVADAGAAAASAQPAGPADISSTLFDYVGFERRFRGDPEVINAVLHDRYAAVLREHQPVVDIGCGRGELLELLAREGVEVVGVEPDPGMADEARARGLEVHQVLAHEYFATVPDDSLGAVISTHVVEHLPLDVLVDFLETSARKLRPGGVFIAETPNPATLVVLGSHFIMDPTHEWPLHPDLLRFLSESAGFREVRTEFFSPATTLQLPLGGGPDPAAPELAARVDEGFARLNHVLFGPQDYAVLAVAGPSAGTPAEGADADPAESLS
ncbi:class I SAM-dependent methyltransferase [Geodermatophilus marinus]|uniref:class I SAM-dependent methyltransferase n=1 Tax=Geodermatophilus sp. LHW52908 TaxID=2303986 RepID=UPI000E3C2951|nr:methyltransferase domain-containing protein [Geodermatophilus sp. LHW52908]RFU21762.1 methyltransferase domain-containing protein [Geodermatophilus sp. LHW52908]